MIVDANIVLRWLLPGQSDPFSSTIIRRTDLTAPPVLEYEVGHVLTKRFRQRKLTTTELNLLWSKFCASPLAIGSAAPVQMALDLSLRVDLSFYDACYLASAIEAEDVVVTADERMARAVRSRPDLARYIVLASEV